MALYELNADQVGALQQIVAKATIPGAAARLVASIQDALDAPVTWEHADADEMPDAEDSGE
jgi:hypothetical protein